MKEKIEKDFENLQKENLSLADDHSTLKSKIKELEKKQKEMENKNKDMIEEIEFMKQREIERIQQLDLDDIDLISHSQSNIRRLRRDHHNNISKPNPIVPKLDFTKIFEWRDKQNIDEERKKEREYQEDKQEYDEDIPLSYRKDYVGKDINIEEYNSPTSINTQFDKFYPSGSEFHSSKTVSMLRKEELQERKAAVINELNETYTEDQRESISNVHSDHYYDQGDDTGKEFQ